MKKLWPAAKANHLLLVVKFYLYFLVFVFRHDWSSEFHRVLILDVVVFNLVCQLMMESLLCIGFGHLFS